MLFKKICHKIVRSCYQRNTYNQILFLRSLVVLTKVYIARTFIYFKLYHDVKIYFVKVTIHKNTTPDEGSRPTARLKALCKSVWMESSH